MESSTVKDLNSQTEFPTNGDPVYGSFIIALHHLGNDASSLGQKLQRDIKKEVNGFKSSLHVKTFCLKLATIILKHYDSIKLYVKKFEEKIKEANLEEEYEDVLKKVLRVLCDKCDGCEKVNELDQTVVTTSQGDQKSNKKTLDHVIVISSSQSSSVSEASTEDIIQETVNVSKDGGSTAIESSSNLDKLKLKTKTSNSGIDISVVDNGLEKQSLTNHNSADECDDNVDAKTVKSNNSETHTFSQETVVVNFSAAERIRMNDLCSQESDKTVNSDLSQDSLVFDLAQLEHNRDENASPLPRENTEIDTEIEDQSKYLENHSKGQDDGDASESAVNTDSTEQSSAGPKLSDQDKKAVFKMMHKFCTEKRKTLLKTNYNEDSSSEEENLKRTVPTKRTRRKKMKRTSKGDKNGSREDKTNSRKTLASKNLVENQKADSDSEGVLSMPKKKKLVPLQTSESEGQPNSDSAKVKQPRNRRQSHDKGESLYDGVSPYKRKSVLPLKSSDNETDSDKRPESRGPTVKINNAKKRRISKDETLEETHQENIQLNESDPEESTEELNTNQLLLCDTDRDNLLNLLTDKEKENENNYQSELGDDGRDELLDLLNQGDNVEDTEDSDKDDVFSDETTKKFHLSDEMKAEMLQYLDEYFNQTIIEAGNSKVMPKMERQDLLDLIQNYEDTMNEMKDKRKKMTFLSLVNAIPPLVNKIASSKASSFPKPSSFLKDFNPSKASNVENQDPLSDSDTESNLLDIVREEIVKNPCKKSRKNSETDDSAAWDAYQSMMEEEDSISETCSTLSDVDVDDWNEDILEQAERKSKRKKETELRELFGCSKELIVNLERADISEYDASLTSINTRRRKPNSNSDDERLCNLSDLFSMEKRDKNSNSKRKRSQVSSSDESKHSSMSSSSASDSDEDLLFDSDLTDIEKELTAPIDNNQEQDQFAKSLWDTIQYSSDELDSSLLSDIDDSSDEEKKKSKKKKPAKVLSDGDSGGSDRKETVKGADLDSSDEEDFIAINKGNQLWQKDPLLHVLISSSSSSDTDDENLKKKKRLRKSLQQTDEDMDSDTSIIQFTELTSASKAIEIVSNSDSDFEIIEKSRPPKKKSVDLNEEEDLPTKKGKGRRNIRALVAEADLAEATQRAHNEEKERIRRLQDKERSKESCSAQLSQSSTSEVEPLILDASGDISIEVHKKIIKKLKPHQKLGIQFMWESCYESIGQLQSGYEGSGCVLAHCMGLGKTLQALALIEALFRNQDVTKTKHVIVVCPLSTVSNWRDEFDLAYQEIGDCKVKLYTIGDGKVAKNRFQITKRWRKTGGMLVLGYECFGLMINEKKLKKFENEPLFSAEEILECLVNPGPDLIICDEGHLLRNKQSQRTLALNKLKTRRRIVLTGTPLQNNLLEYYCMVNFVKPSLLGTEKEFKTNFVNPISNGQFEDSTAEDIMYMKKRTHVLHKILNRTVQRVEDTELKQYLPKLIDQALFIKLSDLQVKLYNTYLETTTSKQEYTKSGNINRKRFLGDVQMFKYICMHPNLVTTAENNCKAKIKEQDIIEDNLDDDIEVKEISKGEWHKTLLPMEGAKKLELGSKMLVTIGIVKEAVSQGDKVLIFANSYAEMDNIQLFLSEHLNYKKGVDFYRMDGLVNPALRTHMCNKFNNPKNTQVKVFIMSTKVGGLGLNLTAANRVIIASVNWNPSYDTQSVFRAFRFGQKKAVYVYRLIAVDTMEEKMYQRVVTKLAIAHRVVDKHQITRHYNLADIQEYYSVRPSFNKERPVPKVPEDRVLANLIQKYKDIYRWHEHQALLTNRPEEDLDEQQKNAAWDEYNKKPDPRQNVHLPANVTRAQPGPSGRQHNVNPIQSSAPMQSGPQQSSTILNYSDHNYSQPKTNFQNSLSLEDFSNSPNVSTSHPIMISVNNPEFVLPLSSDYHDTRSYDNCSEYRLVPVLTRRTLPSRMSSSDDFLNPAMPKMIPKLLLFKRSPIGPCNPTNLQVHSSNSVQNNPNRSVQLSNVADKPINLSIRNEKQNVTVKSPVGNAAIKLQTRKLLEKQIQATLQTLGQEEMAERQKIGDSQLNRNLIANGHNAKATDKNQDNSQTSQNSQFTAAQLQQIRKHMEHLHKLQETENGNLRKQETNCPQSSSTSNNQSGRSKAQDQLRGKQIIHVATNRPLNNRLVKVYQQGNKNGNCVPINPSNKTVIVSSPKANNKVSTPPRNVTYLKEDSIKINPICASLVSTNRTDTSSSTFQSVSATSPYRKVTLINKPSVRTVSSNKDLEKKDPSRQIIGNKTTFKLASKHKVINPSVLKKLQSECKRSSQLLNASSPNLQIDSSRTLVRWNKENNITAMKSGEAMDLSKNADPRVKPLPEDFVNKLKMTGV